MAAITPNDSKIFRNGFLKQISRCLSQTSFPQEKCPRTKPQSGQCAFCTFWKRKGSIPWWSSPLLLHQELSGRITDYRRWVIENIRTSTGWPEMGGVGQDLGQVCSASLLPLNTRGWGRQRRRAVVSQTEAEVAPSKTFAHRRKQPFAIRIVAFGQRLRLPSWKKHLP